MKRLFIAVTVASLATMLALRARTPVSLAFDAAVIFFSARRAFDLQIHL